MRPELPVPPAQQIRVGQPRAANGSLAAPDLTKQECQTQQRHTCQDRDDRVQRQQLLPKSIQINSP